MELGREKTLGVTSKVLKYPADWSQESYLIPHEPIRLGLREAQEILHRGIGSAWKVRLFFEWFDYFEHLVHSHHDIEEQLFFPWLNTRCTVPPKNTADHVGLMDFMKKLHSHKTKLLAQKHPTSEDLNALTRDWDAFVTDMEDHLTQEEIDIPPLLKQHFTEEENDAFVTSILQRLGIEGNAKELPWIIEAMRVWRGVDETEVWLENEVPLPIRIMYNLTWKATYEEAYTNKLRTLKQDIPPAAQTTCTLQ